MMELRFVDAENTDFHSLTARLDEYYFMLVGDVEKRYAKYNLPHLFNCRIVAYKDGAPAGCGAWKQIDETTFEVKRIFIAPEFRRQGVASDHCGARTGRAGERLHACHSGDRAHDCGQRRALHKKRLSCDRLLRQSGRR